MKKNNKLTAHVYKGLGQKLNPVSYLEDHAKDLHFRCKLALWMGHDEAMPIKDKMKVFSLDLLRLYLLCPSMAHIV